MGTGAVRCKGACTTGPQFTIMVVVLRQLGIYSWIGPARAQMLRVCALSERVLGMDCAIITYHTSLIRFSLVFLSIYGWETPRRSHLACASNRLALLHTAPPPGVNGRETPSTYAAESWSGWVGELKAERRAERLWTLVLL